MNPWTRKAAVITVLPQIVNSEHVQTEFVEVYDLAKQYLKEKVK